MYNLQEILKQYWGFDAFRPLQEDVIISVLAGNHTLALMPTGGGKSLCYQVPAMSQRRNVPGYFSIDRIDERPGREPPQEKHHRFCHFFRHEPERSDHYF